MAVPEKLKTKLPYDPEIPFPYINLKELKEGFQRDSCALIFISALFTTVKRWKQLKYPTDKWINKCGKHIQ